MMWKKMVGELLRFVEYIGTNMTVFPHSSYVIYYNIKNTIVKLESKGWKSLRVLIFFTFLDYTEDLKLVKSFN